MGSRPPVQFTDKILCFINNLRVLAGFLDNRRIPVDAVRFLGEIRFGSASWPSILDLLRRENILRDGACRVWKRGTYIPPVRNLRLRTSPDPPIETGWTLGQLRKLALHLRGGATDLVPAMLHTTPDELAARRRAEEGGRPSSPEPDEEISIRVLADQTLLRHLALFSRLTARFNGPLPCDLSLRAFNADNAATGPAARGRRERAKVLGLIICWKDPAAKRMVWDLTQTGRSLLARSGASPAPEEDVIDLRLILECGYVRDGLGRFVKKQVSPPRTATPFTRTP